jgi:hypothetical protein
MQQTGFASFIAVCLLAFSAANSLDKTISLYPVLRSSFFLSSIWPKNFLFAQKPLQNCRSTIIFKAKKKLLHQNLPFFFYAQLPNDFFLHSSLLYFMFLLPAFPQNANIAVGTVIAPRAAKIRVAAPPTIEIDKITFQLHSLFFWLQSFCVNSLRSVVKFVPTSVHILRALSTLHLMSYSSPIVTGYPSFIFS